MPIESSTWTKPCKRRPNTATLERPEVLDPSWARKLDMTTLTRESLMTIDNLLLSQNLKNKCSSNDKRVCGGTYRLKQPDKKALIDISPGKDLTQTKPKPDSKKCLEHKKEPEKKDNTSPYKSYEKAQHTLRSKPGIEDGDNKVVKNTVVKPVAIKFKSAKRKPLEEVTSSSCQNHGKTPISPVTPVKTPTPGRGKKEEAKKVLSEKKGRILSVRHGVVPSKVQSSEVICHFCSEVLPEHEVNSHQCNRNQDEDCKWKPAAYCYICGKVFEKESVVLEVHEKECLSRWHLRNNQLPPEQKQREPVKPDNVLINVASIDDSSWQKHLTQLVPCVKCGRTFNPERVKIHEKSCKATSSTK